MVSQSIIANFMHYRRGQEGSKKCEQMMLKWTGIIVQFMLGGDGWLLQTVPRPKQWYSQ